MWDDWATHLSLSHQCCGLCSSHLGGTANSEGAGLLSSTGYIIWLFYHYCNKLLQKIQIPPLMVPEVRSLQSFSLDWYPGLVPSETSKPESVSSSLSTSGGNWCSYSCSSLLWPPCFCSVFSSSAVSSLPSSLSLSFFFFCFPFSFFGRPAAYVVPGSGIRSELQLWPKAQLWQCQVLNPLCRAGDGSCAPLLPRHRQSHCTTAGNSRLSFYKDTYNVEYAQIIQDNLPISKILT